MLQVLIATRYVRLFRCFNGLCLLSWVFTACIYRDDDEDMNTKRIDLLKCRDRLLGSRASRDNRRVWFEEQDRATDIGENTRCYGLSNMFERIPNTSAPPAALKVVDGKLDAVQLAVKDTLRVSGILDKFCHT